MRRLTLARDRLSFFPSSLSLSLRIFLSWLLGADGEIGNTCRQEERRTGVEGSGVRRWWRRSGGGRKGSRAGGGRNTTRVLAHLVRLDRSEARTRSDSDMTSPPRMRFMMAFLLPADRSVGCMYAAFAFSFAREPVTQINKCKWRWSPTQAKEPSDTYGRQ